MLHFGQDWQQFFEMTIESPIGATILGRLMRVSPIRPQAMDQKLVLADDTVFGETHGGDIVSGQREKSEIIITRA